MRTLFTLGLACLLGSCAEKKILATTESACHVQLPTIYSGWDKGAYAPQIISTFSLSGLRGAQSLYQLFWLQSEGLFREQRNEAGAREEPQTLLVPDVSVFDVTNHQEKALAAYAQRREGENHLFVSYGNATKAFLQKIQSTESRPIESIAIAAQGATAVVVYTVQTNEGLQTYQQTIDLCPFDNNDDEVKKCYSSAVDKFDTQTQEMIWKVSPNDAPAFIEKANVLNQGALSITPAGKSEFVISLENSQSQRKLYRLTRQEESQPFQIIETFALPADRYPLRGETPLVHRKENGQAYAFYTQDALHLDFVALEQNNELHHIAFSTNKGALRSYAAVLPYNKSATPLLEPEFAALWFGAGPLQRGNRQLAFAKFTSSKGLLPSPLWVLPGEEMRTASMAVIDRNGLRFGVFYQHEDNQVGLDFVQIECSPR
jgi:hypothetical protein